MNDVYKLYRFVEAQEPVYADVVAELSSGIKRGHWIWFVFPQIRGLGHSPMSERFSISSIDEARAYGEHPLLGSRLLQCTELVLAVEGRPVEQVFGHPDYLKFRSSMTLFARASEYETYKLALEKYFDGQPDPLTLEILEDV